MSVKITRKRHPKVTITGTPPPRPAGAKVFCFFFSKKNIFLTWVLRLEEIKYIAYRIYRHISPLE